MFDTSKIKIYILTNGNLFFSRGSWVNRIENAQLFTKISTCRLKNTNLFKNTGNIYEILEITGGSFQIINDEERLKNAKNKRDQEKLEYQKRRLVERENDLKKQINRLNKELENLNDQKTFKN